jgi:hypothetical protein
MPVPRAFVSISVKDSKNTISTTNYSMPRNVDIAVASTWAVRAAELIDNIVTGSIASIGIGIEIAISEATGLKATPLANSDVEEGALFTFRTVIGSLTGTRLPTFDEAKMQSGTPNVNVTDTDVNAYVQHVLQGQTNGLINASPSDERGEDISALDSATEAFRSTRKR